MPSFYAKLLSNDDLTDIHRKCIQTPLCLSDNSCRYFLFLVNIADAATVAY